MGKKAGSGGFKYVLFDTVKGLIELNGTAGPQMSATNIR